MNIRIVCFAAGLLFCRIVSLQADLPAYLANRVVLTNEHVDLGVLDLPSGTNALTLIASDEDHEIQFAATDPRLETSRPAIIAQLATDTMSGRRLGTVAIVGRADAASWSELSFQSNSALSWASPEALRALPPQPVPDGPPGKGLAVWRGLDSKFVDESTARYYRVGIRLK